MSDADLLLDAIFDNPDDDTPRLVYADWLEEHGQENYAQFIRLQCEAARHKFWSDEANELWVEIGRVWNRLMREWWPATAEDWLVDKYQLWDGTRSEGYELARLDAAHFCRGFLQWNIAVTAEQLFRHADCWPWLPTPATELVAGSWDDLTALPSNPILRRLRFVRCGDCWEEEYGPAQIDFNPPPSDYLNSLLRSPHLCRVRRLDLSRVVLVPSTVDVLLTAPNLASVEDIIVNIYRNAVVGPNRRRDFDEVTRPLISRFKLSFHP